MRSTLSMCSSLAAKPANGPMRAAVRATGGVGMAGHQRRQAPQPTHDRRRVVGVAERHQQRAEVGVAETELAELAARLGDRLRRVVGAADEDLLGGEHHLDRVPVRVDVERLALVEVLQQVDRGEIARRVVEVHVLGAVAYDNAVGDVRVVARLAQVVRELDAVVGALGQPDRRVRRCRSRGSARRSPNATSLPCGQSRTRSRPRT